MWIFPILCSFFKAQRVFSESWPFLPAGRTLIAYAVRVGRQGRLKAILVVRCLFYLIRIFMSWEDIAGMHYALLLYWSSSDTNYLASGGLWWQHKPSPQSHALHNHTLYTRYKVFSWHIIEHKIIRSTALTCPIITKAAYELQKRETSTEGKYWTRM